MDTGIVGPVNNWCGLTPYYGDDVIGFDGSLSPRLNFFNSGGQVVWEKLNSSYDYKNLFNLCAPLAAVITMKAEAFANGVFEAVNPNTDNYLRGKYKEWDELFANPNPIQARAQFTTQLSMYVSLRGYCYALPVYPAGFNDRPETIWLLPPWCIEVEPLTYRKPFWQYRKGEARRRVFFTCDGLRTELNESDLILFTDNGSDIDPHTMLPEGRLRTLTYPVSNLIGSMQSRAALIQNRGATGILTTAMSESSQMSALPMEPEEKERLQRQYSGQGAQVRGQYGLGPGQYNVIVTEAALKWQPMTFNVQQLGLHEEYLSNIKDIYAAFGVPFPLSTHSDQSTYNNINSAQKALYQDTVIPEAKAIVEQLNAGLKLRDKGVKVIVSYEDVSYLQQSEAERGQGRKAMNDGLQVEWDNNLITRNMWLKDIGRDTIEKGELAELFNKYKFQLTPEELGVMGLNDTEDEQGDNATQSGQSSTGEE